MADKMDFNSVEIKATLFSKDVKKGSSKVPIEARVVDAKPKVLLTYLNINLLNKQTPFIAYLPVGEEITLTLEFQSPVYGLLVEEKSFIVRNKPQTVEFTFASPKFPGGYGAGPTAPPGPSPPAPPILPTPPAPTPSPVPPRPSPHPSTPGAVVGKVTDKDKKKLAGVTVSILYTTKTTITDSDGKYRIDNVNFTGTIYIEAKDPKFATSVLEKERKRPDEITRADFVLETKKPVKVPERRQISVGGLNIHLSKAIGSIIAIVIGLIVSALLGNLYFFFGFFFIGAHILMPDMEDLYTVRKRMQKVKQFFNVRVNDIQSNKSISDEEKIRQMDRLVRLERNALDAERIARQEYTGVFNRVSGAIIFKHLFKALGTLSFVFAFVNTGIPFSNIIALIAAFVGYFAIGGYKIPGGAPEKPA